MPVGYLISMIIPAVPAVAAAAPSPLDRTAGQLCWRLTMQVNELPLVVAVWVLAGTALAAAQGELLTPVGLAGMVVAAGTLAALALVLWRGTRARSAVARALAAGLGVGWQSRVPDAAARLARRQPWTRLLLTPFAQRPRDVVRQSDLRYGPAGTQNLLDVFVSRSGVMTGPCLVYFHGGGYRSGRKNREARALMHRLASLGWLCVSANYRLARSGPYPAPLVDAKRVVAWVSEHAASYCADGSTIVVAGSSAGAHLAAMVALTPGMAALQPGFEAADTSVSAAVCLYGFYGSPGWIARGPGAPSAPVELLSPGAPPMLIAHGDHDSFVPVAEARDFAMRFRAAAPGTPLVYLELPGAQHTFDLYNSVRFSAVVDAVDAFATRVLPARSSRAGGAAPTDHPT